MELTGTPADKAGRSRGREVRCASLHSLPSSLWQPSSGVQVQQLEVAAYVKGRFGRDGHRVWRLLNLEPHLQLDAIAKQAMLELRTARSLVFRLFRHGYLQACSCSCS